MKENTKYILTDKSGYLYFVKDGQLSPEPCYAYRFSSNEAAEKKSMELQLKGVPTYFIQQTD